MYDEYKWRYLISLNFILKINLKHIPQYQLKLWQLPAVQHFLFLLIVFFSYFLWAALTFLAHLMVAHLISGQATCGH